MGARIARYKADEEYSFPRHLHSVRYRPTVHHDLQLSFTSRSYVNYQTKYQYVKSHVYPRKRNIPMTTFVVIITARKRSLRRLCFYTSLSIIMFTGEVCLSACWDSRNSPWEQTPPLGAEFPPTSHPPLRSACWESGRYASYWNAYLLKDESL